MSATLERSLLVREASRLAGELRDAVSALSSSPETPASVIGDVSEWIRLIEGASMPPPDDVDPYFLIALEWAALHAQEALSKDDPERRDSLRVCLEQWRQVFRDIAEQDPISDERAPSDVARWVLDNLSVPVGRVAELINVSPRSYQRWVSSESSPRPDEERRLRVIAHIASNLRHVMTGPGVVQWLLQPRKDLKDRRPFDLLDDASDAPHLLMIATSARSMRNT